MLIVVAHHTGIHMRRIRDGVNNVTVQQFPAEPLRDGLRNAPATAAELPVYCQYSVFHFPPLIPVTIHFIPPGAFFPIHSALRHCSYSPGSVLRPGREVAVLESLEKALKGHFNLMLFLPSS